MLAIVVASLSSSAAAPAAAALLLLLLLLQVDASREGDRHFTATSVPCHLHRYTSPNEPPPMYLQQQRRAQVT
jgi:hypothetical protein